jgi:hypothetical protein
VEDSRPEERLVESLSYGPVCVATTDVEINDSSCKPAVDLLAVDGDHELVRRRLFMYEPNRIDRKVKALMRCPGTR